MFGNEIEMRPKKAEVNIDDGRIIFKYSSDCDHIFFYLLKYFCDVSKIACLWNNGERSFEVVIYEFYRLNLCLKRAYSLCQRYYYEYRADIFGDIAVDIDNFRETYGNDVWRQEISDIYIDQLTVNRLLSICKSANSSAGSMIRCLFFQNEAHARVVGELTKKINYHKTTFQGLYDYIKNLKNDGVVQRSSLLSDLRMRLLQELGIMMKGYKFKAAYESRNVQLVL